MEEHLKQSEDSERKSAIAICTTTFYKQWQRPEERTSDSSDTIRGDLALETVRTALENGYHVVIVDGGSSEEFLQALPHSDFLHMYEQKERGIGSSRREVFDHARKIPSIEAVCWTEPEKVNYVQRGIHDAAASVLRGEEDLVIVGRKDLSSLPDYQRKSELQCNRIYNGCLRKAGLLDADIPDWDFFFGPRVIANREAVWELFDHQYAFSPDETAAPLDHFVNPEDLSSTLFFPFVEGLRKESHVRVGAVLVDYTHPRMQTAYEQSHRSEFDQKRQKQRADIVGALKHFLLMLAGKKSKLSRK